MLVNPAPAVQLDLLSKPVPIPGDDRFICILSDPPWDEKGGGKCKRGADRHYPTMKTKDILALMWSALYPIKGGCRILPSAHHWMWVTNNFLEDGLLVMRRLGFRYITNISWVKLADRAVYGPKEAGLTTIQVAESALQNGLGQYTQGAHELLLFGTRGSAMVPDPKNRPLTVMFEERTEHSRKPEDQYRVINSVTPPGPRVEMFARRDREGWTSWGNEISIPGDEDFDQSSASQTG